MDIELSESERTISETLQALYERGQQLEAELNKVRKANSVLKQACINASFLSISDASHFASVKSVIKDASHENHLRMVSQGAVG